jgi:hypothetical protein
MALIASTSKGSSNGHSVFATVTTDAINTTGANLLVVSVHFFNSNFASSGATVSDSKGNTWTGATARVTDTTHNGVRFFYCFSPSVGSGHTVTFPTGSSGICWPTVTFSAWSDAVSSLVGENGTATASNVITLSTGSVVPSASFPAIVISALTYQGTSPSVSGGSLAIEESVAYDGATGGHEGGVMAYEIQAAGASIGATWNWTTASDAAVSIIAFGVSTTTIVGSESHGVNTTVTATRAVAFGLDGDTHEHDEAGKFIIYGDFEVSGTSTIPGVTSNRTIGIVIGNGSEESTTGVKGFVSAPFTGTITKARLLSTDASSTSGSIVIDVWKDTYANYPPTNVDSITASAPPTLSSAAKSEDSTLTGWTTSVTTGDVIGFNVDSVSTVTRVLLELTVVL